MKDTMSPYVLIFPKEVLPFIKGNWLFNWLHLIVMIDGDTAYFIKNRFERKEQIPVEELPKYISDMYDFWGDKKELL